MKTKRILLMFLTGLAFGLTTMHNPRADDTDIYFTDPNIGATQIKPNIMLILDTSGSMNTCVDEDNSGSCNGSEKTRLEHMKDALDVILDNTSNVKMGLMRFSGQEGGPVLFPIADLDAKADDIEGIGSKTLQIPMSLNSDDAEENTSTGAVDVSSTTLDLINDGANDQVVGLRFQDVNIPRGVTITSASIKFQVEDATPAGATSLTIKGEASDNAATFTTATNDISGRAQTTASVPWSAIPVWPTVGDNQVTPDLTTIVQEVVSRANWCGGNAMAFFLSGSGQRIASSYDGDPAGAPVLTVTYDPTTVPATGGCVNVNLLAQVASSRDDAEERLSNGNMDRNNNELQMIRRGTRDQAVGVRFRNLDIPQGATITSAQLEFTIETQQSTTTNLTIEGHDTNDAPNFGSSNYDITNRTRTTASVSWSSVPNLTVGSKLVSPSISSVVQEIVNRGGWAPGNDMAFIITGSGTRTVESFDGNAALAPILRVKYQKDATAATPSNLTVRDRLKEIITGMRASGSTPIVDTLYEAGLYYRGQNVLYGLQRGDQSGSDARYTRVSHPATYTGATGVYRAAGCTDADLDASACETEEIQGSPTYKSPFEANSCQPNYIVLLTDGDPTANNSVSDIETLIGNSCTAETGSGQCSSELVDYYYNTDLDLVLGEKQNIVTHTIGFNNAGDPDYLRGVANAGHGTYNTASTASELATVFQGIFNEVLKAPTSFVSPSLTVNAFNKLFNRDEVYFSLFSPQLSVKWPGNLKRYRLCGSGEGGCQLGEVVDANSNPAIGADSKILGTAQSFWSSTADGPEITVGGAGDEILDPPGTTPGRRVYTYTGTADFPATPVDLSANAHKVETTNGSLTQAMLGAASGTERDEIINWMRGQDREDENTNVNKTERRWAFGDALHSRPLTLTYGGTAANPVIKIFVGTNDGGLRMVDAATGGEDWIVYLPEFLDKQKDLKDDANGAHIYGVDGSPTALVVDHNNDGVIDPTNTQDALGTVVDGTTERIHIFVGMRRGGRDIYAFDVTPDAAPLTTSSPLGTVTPKLLWRIKGGTGDFGDLGQSWSQPQIATIRVKCNNAACSDGDGSTKDSEYKTVLIFSGGYDSSTLDPAIPTGADTIGNAIYIVDPVDGSLIWRAGGSGSGADLVLSNMNYSIPSDLALLDSNADRAVDRIYVGDTRGQLWRIDLSNQIDPLGTNANQRNGGGCNPSQGTDSGSCGYVLADIGCTGGTRADHCSATTKQNRRKFFFPPDVAQVTDEEFSTTPNYDLITIATGDRADPLDGHTKTVSEDPVNNRIYAFRDVNIVLGPPTSTPTPLTETNLYDANPNDLSDPSGASYAAAVTAIQSTSGWYVDMKEASAPLWIGEKSLARTTIFDDKLFVTTFTPSQSGAAVCPGPSEGIAKLYTMNYLTGSSVTPGGNIEQNLGGGIPSELVVVIREDGVSGLVGTSGGATNPTLDSELPRYKTFWFDE